MGINRRSEKKYGFVRAALELRAKPFLFLEGGGEDGRCSGSAGYGIAQPCRVRNYNLAPAKFQQSGLLHVVQGFGDSHAGVVHNHREVLFLDFDDFPACRTFCTVQDEVGNMAFKSFVGLCPETAVQVLCPVADDVHIVQTENLIFEQLVQYK